MLIYKLMCEIQLICMLIYVELHRYVRVRLYIKNLCAISYVQCYVLHVCVKFGLMLFENVVSLLHMAAQHTRTFILIKSCVCMRA